MGRTTHLSNMDKKGYTQPDTTYTIYLSGSSKNRRKQFKALQKDYPEYKVTKSAATINKIINGERVVCEDANVPQTYVLLEKKVI